MLKKLKYKLFYLMFLISDKNLEQKEKNRIAERFLIYNNNQVLKSIKKQNIKKVLILLPHCIQYYDCSYKITSYVENCKKCYKCKIANFLDLKEIYPIEIKIANGGTLARKHIKDTKPDLVIAVACKRDLISGIIDAYPIKVLGVFNEIKNEPCISTGVSITKIENYLKQIF